MSFPAGRPTTQDRTAEHRGLALQKGALIYLLILREKEESQQHIAGAGATSAQKTSSSSDPLVI